MSEKHRQTENLIEELNRLKEENQALKAELESKLRQEEDSQVAFRQLFDAAEDSVFIKGTDLRYRDVNAAMEQLFGATHDELIGKTDLELFGAEAAEHIEKSDKKVLAGEVVNEEHTKPVGDRMITFHVIKTPMRNEDGEIDGLCGIARDITARKKDEEMLRNNERLIRSMVENGMDVITLVNEDVSIRYESESIKRVLGYDPEDLVGTSALDLVHPDEKERIAGLFSEYADKPGEPIRIECRYHHKDGSWRDFEAIGVNFLNDPAINAYVVNSRDITERKNIEMELRRHRDRLEELVAERTREITEAVEKLKLAERDKALILDSISEHVVYQDLDHTILWSNRAAAESVNEQINGIAGRKCHEVWSQSGEVCENCPLDRVIKSLKPEESEVATPDGRIWQIKGYPVLNENGELENFVEITREVTEARKAEEQKVAAQKEAEFYLDLMTHDLTNFNSVIYGNLELLEKHSDLIEKAVRFVETCRRQLMKSDSLISRVRAFSQVSEIEEQNLHSVSVADSIREMARIVKRLYPHKSIKVEFDPEARGEARATELIDSVFMNLIENAVKHNVKDDVWIGIDMSEEDDYWAITISDNGQGIPDAMKEKIFDRFQRIGREKGSGLGLSLVRALVEKFNGSIAVEDRIAGGHSGGSVFCVKIPKG
ncbi:MAG TPA: PAS domain-containing protein [bacterium]|nr:PAS domain-containing protein [bacterium]